MVTAILSSILTSYCFNWSLLFEFFTFASQFLRRWPWRQGPNGPAAWVPAAAVAAKNNFVFTFVAQMWASCSLEAIQEGFETAKNWMLWKIPKTLFLLKVLRFVLSLSFFWNELWRSAEHFLNFFTASVQNASSNSSNMCPKATKGFLLSWRLTNDSVTLLQKPPTKFPKGFRTAHEVSQGPYQGFPKACSRLPQSFSRRHSRSHPKLPKAPQGQSCHKAVQCNQSPPSTLYKATWGSTALSRPFLIPNNFPRKAFQGIPLSSQKAFQPTPGIVVSSSCLDPPDCLRRGASRWLSYHDVTFKTIFSNFPHGVSCRWFVLGVSFILFNCVARKQRTTMSYIHTPPLSIPVQAPRVV